MDGRFTTPLAANTIIATPNAPQGTSFSLPDADTPSNAQFRRRFQGNGDRARDEGGSPLASPQQGVRARVLNPDRGLMTSQLPNANREAPTTNPAMAGPYGKDTNEVQNDHATSGFLDTDTIAKCLDLTTKMVKNQQEDMHAEVMASLREKVRGLEADDWIYAKASTPSFKFR